MQLRSVIWDGAGATRGQRVLRWLAVALLCVQLYAITQHHHDLTAHPENCVACNLAAMSCGSAPPVSTVQMALAIILAFWLAARADYVVFLPVRTRLHPPSQAPPLV